MNFELEKLEYDSIEIPKELHTMVNRTIANDRKRRILRRRKAFVKAAASIAAMLVLTLTVGVNSSYAFARTARKVPVVGPVAEVLTVRKYEKEKAADEEYQKELLAQTIVIEEENEVTEEILPIAEVEELVAIPEVVEEGPMTLERWITELSIEKLSQVTELYHVEMEELYAETPEKLDTILLAQIPERDTYLYGYHYNGAKQGVALRIGDKLQYFGWTYMNDTHELPTISYVDMNGDGNEKLVVLLYNTIVAEVQPQTVVEENDEALKTEETISENDETVSGNDISSEKSEDTKLSDNSDNKEASVTVNQIEETGTTSATENKESTGNKTAIVEKNEVPENTAITTTENKTASQVTTDSEKKTGTDSITSETDKTKETLAESTEKTEESTETVSGNDIVIEEPEQEPIVEPKRGELWVICEHDGKLNATVLTENDFSSQILHQLKVDYLEEESALQLYIQEEAFGDKISLYRSEATEKESNSYIKTALDSKVLYEIGEEANLYFELGVWFENASEMDLSIIPSLKAKIIFAGDTFTITGIEFKEDISKEVSEENETISEEASKTTEKKVSETNNLQNN